MNHAITIGGLLLSVGCFIGLALGAIGLLMVFAGGMSDAPAAGESASKQGCIVFVVGAVLLAASIFGLLA